jgi:hypothetical protein
VCVLDLHDVFFSSFCFLRSTVVAAGVHCLSARYAGLAQINEDRGGGAGATVCHRRVVAGDQLHANHAFWSKLHTFASVLLKTYISNLGFSSTVDVRNVG